MSSDIWHIQSVFLMHALRVKGEYAEHLSVFVLAIKTFHLLSGYLFAKLVLRTFIITIFLFSLRNLCVSSARL